MGINNNRRFNQSDEFSGTEGRMAVRCYCICLRKMFHWMCPKCVGRLFSFQKQYALWNILCRVNYIENLKKICGRREMDAQNYHEGYLTFSGSVCIVIFKIEIWRVIKWRNPNCHSFFLTKLSWFFTAHQIVSLTGINIQRQSIIVSIILMDEVFYN